MPANPIGAVSSGRREPSRSASSRNGLSPRRTAMPASNPSSGTPITSGAAFSNASARAISRRLS